MSGIDSVIRKLKDLKHILLTDAQGKSFIKINDDISFEVPSWINNIFQNASLINEQYQYVFLGFEALSKEDIIDFYNSRNSGKGFYSAYDIDKNLNVGEDKYILLEDDFQNELENPIEIKNLAGLIPIFFFQGDYITFNLSQNEEKGLMIINDGYNATTLSPDVINHLEDLIDGLTEGSYKLDDGELIYPSSWYQRKKLRSGELDMDEYGEILD